MIGWTALSKDVLVQEDYERIKERITCSQRFCYYRDLNGWPEKTEEGRKILFSDGDRVRAESILIEVSKGEFRCEVPTAVNRPLPESSPARGFKYVDAEEAGRYHINFTGIEHSYRNFHECVKGILENVPGARNDFEELKYQVWIHVQDLDLSRREEFSQRISEGNIRKVLLELQVGRVVFPPTSPEVVEKRFKQSSKGSRRFSLEDYVEKVKGFYQERGRDVSGLDDYFSFSKNSSDAVEVVREKVAEQ